jgi:hypothetical protein
MFTRSRLWLSLTAALLAGTGCSDKDVAAETPHDMQGHNVSTLVSAEAGERGEASAALDVTQSDVAYLTYLALMRGHLSVGVDLYREGAQKAAASHMKHPEDELYVDLLPGLQARGAGSLAEELAALANVVENGGGVEEVNAAFAQLSAAMDRAEAAAGNQPPAVIGEVVHRLVRTAAEEYDIAVEAGRLVNAHEYQDALGFVRTAQELAERLEGQADPQVVAEIRQQLAALTPIWPSAVPPAQVTTAPSKLYGAAARIEQAVLSL